jgi:hypothetical protein
MYVYFLQCFETLNNAGGIPNILKRLRNPTSISQLSWIYNIQKQLYISHITSWANNGSAKGQPSNSNPITWWLVIHEKLQCETNVQAA